MALVSRMGCVWLLAIGLPAQADSPSVFPMSAAASGAALTGLPRSDSSLSPSLFAGRAGNSLFAPRPPRSSDGSPPLAGSTRTAQLLSLIARAEAGSAGYDAVQHGARIRPPRPPTQMTLAEIYAWIAATPGQPHAIGRYQFIPSTLREVAGIAGVSPEIRFSPRLQDRLAHVLLERAGLAAFQSGQMDRRTFMHNLARIWAGLPLPSGRSYYEGYAGNSATMSWAAFEDGMRRIWPDGTGQTRS